MNSPPKRGLLFLITCLWKYLDSLGKSFQQCLIHVLCFQMQSGMWSAFLMKDPPIVYSQCMSPTWGLSSCSLLVNSWRNEAGYRIGQEKNESVCSPSKQWLLVVTGSKQRYQLCNLSKKCRSLKLAVPVSTFVCSIISLCNDFFPENSLKPIYEDNVMILWVVKLFLTNIFRFKQAERCWLSSTMTNS